MGEKTYETSDIGVAAFLHMSGFRATVAEEGQGGIYTFVFEDPNGEADDFAFRFFNDPCARYDNAMRNLKKMIAESRRRKAKDPNDIRKGIRVSRGWAV